MSRRRYTYSVIRYTHDPIAGESMNVGVLLYSPEASFVDVQLLFQYQRLSDAFAGFDGDGYRRSLRAFIEALAGLRDELFSSLVRPSAVPADAKTVVERIWPDRQLSLVAGPPMTGASDDFPATLAQLFDRFVLSQYHRGRDERRSDDEVWQSFRERLQGTVVPSALTPVKIQTNNLSAEFLGFRNERWHFFQPISLDFIRETSIKRKAKEFIGEFVELADNADVLTGKIYLLLGSPTHPEFREAYESAKQMLRKIPVDHRMIEESEAEAFAIEMDEYVRKHVAIA
jgi:Protein of unknown function (DUF3037)